MWELDSKESWVPKNWCFWTVVLEKTLESPLGLQGNPTSLFWRRSALGFLWKEWCESWNSSTLATSCEVLTHWKRLWCWEGLGAGGEGDDRGWDGWMASRTHWTLVLVNSGRWWRTGRPGVLWFMGSQRVGHNWATELNTAFRDAHTSHSKVLRCKEILAKLFWKREDCFSSTAVTEISVWVSQVYNYGIYLATIISRVCFCVSVCVLMGGVIGCGIITI